MFVFLITKLSYTYLLGLSKNYDDWLHRTYNTWRLVFSFLEYWYSLNIFLIFFINFSLITHPIIYFDVVWPQCFFDNWLYFSRRYVLDCEVNTFVLIFSTVIVIFDYIFISYSWFYLYYHFLTLLFYSYNLPLFLLKLWFFSFKIHFVVFVFYFWMFRNVVYFY